VGNGRFGGELSQGKSVRRLSTFYNELNHGLKLVTMDAEKRVIAQFHRAHHFTKKQKARLEIQPEGISMLDHIVLTFVIVECNRRAREAGETAATSSDLYL
jgi:hypothetical protein